MKNKTMSKKVICLVIIGTMLTPTMTFAKENISKDETVYVTMYEDGSVKSSIVSDWLHSDVAANEIKDKSILNNIKNIKGKEVPDKNGDILTWKTDKKDLFYQGDTNQQLPLSFKITYYLNDSEISPKALAGKSGKIKIKIAIENKEKHMTTVNGKLRTIYTPMTVASIVNLPMDTFSNIKTNGAPLVSIGNNKVVSFVSFPGLKESLGIETGAFGIDLPENLEITADATKFKMGPILITATPELPDMKEIKAADSLEDLTKGLNTLKIATNTIQDGAIKLNDGLSTAQKKVSGLGGELSKNDDKLSLVNDEDNVNAERKLIEDAFMAMNMDTSLLNLVPKYVTPQNMSMAMKTVQDLKAADLTTIMQDPLLKKLPALMTQDNLQNANKLLKDTAALSQVDMTKLDPLMALLNNSNQLKGLMGQAGALAQLDMSKLDPLMPLLNPAAATELNSLLTNANSLKAVDVTGMKAFLDTQIAGTDAFKANSDILNKPENIAALKSAIDIAYPASAVPEINANLKGLIDGYSNLTSQTSLNMQASKIYMTGTMAPALTGLAGVKAQLSNDASVIGGVQSALTTDNVNNVTSMLGQLKTMQAALKTPETAQLIAGVQSALSDENVAYLKAVLPQLKAMQSDLASNAQNLQVIKALLEKASDPKTAETIAKIKVLEQDYETAKPLLTELQGQITPELVSKIGSSPILVTQLTSMQKDLTTNKKILEIVQDSLSENNVERANQLIEALPTLTKGINDLAEGSKTLSDGIKEFNTNGIMKLDSTAAPKLQEVKDILSVKDELVKLSEDYKSFTGIAEGTEGTVKFVMRTDEIKVVEAKQNKKLAVKEEKKSFWQWVKSLF